ncbi:xanthine dehydrogenase small subunit [Acidovorax sp. NCPPB 4044]|uniref:xanthine dehydrogenase small subunit n=1 Tax=Acidovorax sp. NCPPB 4044 TaxID=2940490 RepID=UPI0023032627|nr:xanthine dehydrogenase small subunit [Acidovorax sp. NCPPB 4044]MDA8519629.1 xanthine dehydrogenase small subunit [Acidovorax sp. NCPPB 4044]
MPRSRPLRFIRRGQPVELGGVPPDRTLLELLREDLGDCATKEGCGEGDCGACTVVLGSAVEGRVRLQAVNSCIRLAHSIDGMALWTAEDLAQDPLIQRTAAPEVADTPAPPAARPLHPAQEALVQCHGSQCGFCTPGFVMSLFAMYQNHVCQGRAITRERAAVELSGNLCRCTGYRPILEAAQRMGEWPVHRLDEDDLLQKLEQTNEQIRRHGADLASISTVEDAYLAPSTLAGVLAARAAHPDAQVVAGATDVGLWITKQHRQFARLLDVTRAQELCRIEARPGLLAIGAAATLTDAFAALVGHWPVLQRFAERFAGLPVRNAGTLGGNIANGSPIGDSMPVLIALGARIALASVRGERSVALEDFYTGYRRNLLAPDEVVARIEVPLPGPHDRLAAWKVSKRFDDDISAVCLAVNLTLQGGTVQAARIGAGGVAAVPSRARAAEAALADRPWNEAAALAAGAALQAEFSPISDMRASGAYRRAVLASLLQRCWLESPEAAAAAGAQPATLERLGPVTCPEEQA